MDKVLKQRLLGASILIALAVIFVPMLFNTDESEPERSMDLDLPDAPAGDLEVRRLPLGELSPADRDHARDADRGERDPARARRPESGDSDVTGDNSAEASGTGRSTGETRPEPEASGRADDTQTQPAEATAPEAQADEPEPEPEPDPAPAEPESASTSESASDQSGPPASSPDGDWVVQVASFAEGATAREISDRLRSLGHDAVINVIVRGEGRLHRVRAGPYAGRDDAERARVQIERTVEGVTPVVLSLSGADTGPGEGRWAVQVGSFASEDNADRLRARLRDQGFTTYIHREASGGRAIWKVRVGPVMERGEAETLLERLGGEAGVEGLVVDHP